MPEENDFRRAMSLLMNGRRKEASAVLLPLYQQTPNKGFKVQVIDALFAALDPIQENQRLIDMSSEGIKLAKELGMSDLQAHFMARKADFLVGRLSLLQYHRANLKLVPGWFEFSTEADKDNHEILTKKIEDMEKEIDHLLSEASALAEQIGDKRALAFVLMSKASADSSHYLQYKMECVRTKWQAEVLSLLHKWGFEIPILFGYKHHKVLRAYINAFATNYLKAGKLLEEIDDEGAGLAYYNLSVHLRSAYRFRKARSYLQKADVIAKRGNNALLVAKIRALEKSIIARNRDVPNYLEGETREEIVV